jgi:hypothetical protein
MVAEEACWTGSQAMRRGKSKQNAAQRVLDSARDGLRANQNQARGLSAEFEWSWNLMEWTNFSNFLTIYPCTTLSCWTPLQEDCPPSELGKTEAKIRNWKGNFFYQRHFWIFLSEIAEPKAGGAEYAAILSKKQHTRNPLMHHHPHNYILSYCTNHNFCSYFAIR